MRSLILINGLLCAHRDLQPFAKPVYRLAEQALGPDWPYYRAWLLRHHLWHVSSFPRIVRMMLVYVNEEMMIDDFRLIKTLMSPRTRAHT